LELAKNGVHHRLSREHLRRYLDEICFRWNCRTRFRELDRAKRWRWVIRLKPLGDQLSKLVRSSMPDPMDTELWFEVVADALPAPT
jgi:hypothetical protein